MNIFRHTNKLLTFLIFTIFIYISFLLVSNTSNGFDITDESHYILQAQYMNEIFSTITHDHYYTGILYKLVNQNLSIVRLVGILLLLSISAWFAIELYKYISRKFMVSLNFWDKALFVVPISMGSLAYYRWWLLTPSYNWLALVSIILVFIALLKIVNDTAKNRDSYTTPSYMLLSFSLSLTFMAKPTTALIATMISISFAIYEHKNINFKRALPAITFLTAFIVGMHIVYLDGGLTSYYDRLTEGMERTALMGSGHTLGNRYDDMVSLFQGFFFENFYYHQINIYYLYSFFIAIAMLFLLRHR